VVVTAYATIETAVEAIRRGAWDYLPKPFTPAQIGHLVEKAKAQRATSAKLVDLQDRLQSEAPEIDLRRSRRAQPRPGPGDDPDQVGLVLSPVLSGEADYVQGSRFAKGGHSRGLPAHRNLAIRVFTLTFSLFVGKRFTDCTNGFRAYRTSILRDERIDWWFHNMDSVTTAGVAGGVSSDSRTDLSRRIATASKAKQNELTASVPM
jgi:CheY-like chemotaxis protein